MTISFPEGTSLQTKFDTLLHHFEEGYNLRQLRNKSDEFLGVPIPSVITRSTNCSREELTTSTQHTMQIYRS